MIVYNLGGANLTQNQQKQIKFGSLGGTPA